MAVVVVFVLPFLKELGKAWKILSVEKGVLEANGKTYIPSF